MSIVLIGGHDRLHDRYKRISSKNGHKMKVMTHMKTQFEKRIGSPDGIIIFTNTVSHKMVISAEKTAKKMDIPVVKCHTSSQSALKLTIEALEKIV